MSLLKKNQKKEKNINLINRKYGWVLWAFIKDFIETYSKQQDILLLVDEYDKPVNDCLKYKKHESSCKNNVLEELKDKLFKYFKDIPCIILVTGINKLSMASFFSDFNNLVDVSTKVVLWYTQKDVEDLFDRLGVKYSENVKKWYNWYRSRKNPLEYNPWAINLYLQSEDFDFKPYWSKTWTAPYYFRHLINDILKINDELNKHFDSFIVESLTKEITFKKGDYIKIIGTLCPVFLDFWESAIVVRCCKGIIKNIKELPNGCVLRVKIIDRNGKLETTSKSFRFNDFSYDEYYAKYAPKIDENNNDSLTIRYSDLTY